MDKEFQHSDFFQDPNNLLYNQPEFEDNFLIDVKQEVNHFNADHLQHNDNNDNSELFQHDYNNQQLAHQPSASSTSPQEGSHKRTRASGEVLALLISEFNKNQNPNAQSRKKISDQTGMPERSVRIWFQNRRAKSRKLEKAQANEKEDPFTSNSTEFAPSRYDSMPLNINNNYYFIDAKSLTVGSWKRLKSGNLSSDNIFSVRNLSNLSPFSINDIMDNSTDLMIVISKKNFEINYFFSAITENSKILFRIFFPISSVGNCSLSISNEDEDRDQTCELKLFLNKPPKFAVSFANLISQNSNQWSICDDFSEGHQVNDAFTGGSGIPHVLSGLEQSLKFMNSFILDYNSSNVQPQEFSLPQRFSSRSPTFFQEQSDDLNKHSFNSISNPNPIQQLQFQHPQVVSTSSPPPPSTQTHPNNDQVPNNAEDLSFSQNRLLQQFVKDEFINGTDSGNDSFETFLQQQTRISTNSDIILNIDDNSNDFLKEEEH